MDIMGNHTFSPIDTDNCDLLYNREAIYHERSHHVGRHGPYNADLASEIFYPSRSVNDEMYDREQDLYDIEDNNFHSHLIGSHPMDIKPRTSNYDGPFLPLYSNRPDRRLNNSLDGINVPPVVGHHVHLSRPYDDFDGLPRHGATGIDIRKISTRRMPDDLQQSISRYHHSNGRFSKIHPPQANGIIHKGIRRVRPY